MKKVLFTATVDSHILHFHLPYLKMFKEKGYEVHVATNTDDTIPFCDVKHKVSFERSPFKINNLKAIKQMKKILLDNNFDIVHTHTPMGSVVTRLAYKKVRNKVNTRMIYTAHGFHFYKGAPLLNWLLFYPVEKYLSKYTDTLITINKEDYCLAKKKFRKCRSVEYVPGVGIDIKKFDVNIQKSERNIIIEKFGLNKNDFILTCVARLDKNKNQGFLIDVMKQINLTNKKIHLLLVGPDELNGIYQKKVGDDNVKNVHFLGRREDIPTILSISDIIVSASLREGLPVNIIEAFAAGKPVVVLNCRGMNDLIENEQNGFIISNNNSKSFIDCISLLENNKKMYDTICKNNISKASKYSIEGLLGKVWCIYNDKNNTK